MFKNYNLNKILNPSEKILLFLRIGFFTVFLLSLALIFHGVSFGSFKLDYYESHLITLHQLSTLGFIDGTREMYLSASGSLPLWLQSQLDGLEIRRYLNVIVWVSTLVLINSCALKIGLNKAIAYLLLISYCLSPMMISSVAWGLSEIYALFFIYLAVFLLINDRFLFAIPIIFGFIILCRQNLIALLSFAALFISPRIIKVLSILGGVAALSLLIYLWGGLVPRGLERHMTPSLRTLLDSIAIFSLYFVFCEKSKRRFDLIALALIIIIVTVVIFQSPSLLGGGYIFSRIENYSISLGIMALSIAIYSVYKLRSKILIILIIISSVTLSTTNYIFLKYIDFFVYFIFSIQILVKQYISSVSVQNKYLTLISDDKKSIQLQVISIVVFQLFSLILAYMYYGK